MRDKPRATLYTFMTHPLFFFNDTATTEIYTLSLHDALPISITVRVANTRSFCGRSTPVARKTLSSRAARPSPANSPRSEEHTSELQSRQYIVCRLLLEKKKEKI